MNENALSLEQRRARVVVGVTGSPSSGAALRRAVQEARRTARTLVPVLAWEPPGGEALYRRAPVPELVALWEQQARQRLDTAVSEAIGALPQDVDIDVAVVRAPASFALTRLADRPEDLLVLGAGPRRPLLRTLRGHVRRRTVARAASPVLLVTHPELPHRLRRDLRRLTPDDFRRRTPTFEC